MTYALQPIPPHFVERAWRDGAHQLSKACDCSDGEITGDQLKYMLCRGERQLLRIVRSSEVVGWAVVSALQLPNTRVMHVYALYAPGGHWVPCCDLLAGMARDAGCVEMRCCAPPAQARLYQRKLPWQPLHTTLRMVL